MEIETAHGSLGYDVYKKKVLRRPILLQHQPISLPLTKCSLGSCAGDLKIFEIILGAN